MLETTEKQMPGVTLSVAILSYKNTSHVLWQAISSILEQTVTDTEILLIDRNALGDKFSLSLQEDARDHPELRVISCEGMTEGEARNKALSEARGKYIAFSGGNDLWEPDKAQKQIMLLERSSGAGACFCNGARSAIGGNKVFLEMPTANDLDILFSGLYESPSALVYQADVLRELGGFDEDMDLYCDMDMLLRLKERREIVFTAGYLFTCGEDSGISKEKRYQTLKKLFYKNYEHVVADRKLAYRFHLQFTQLCAGARLWSQMVIHFILAFFKRPFYSLAFFAKVVYTGVTGFVRRRSLRALIASRAAKLRRRLDRFHSEKAWADVTIQPVARDVLQPEERIEARDEALQFTCSKKLRNAHIVTYSSVIREGQFAFCKNLTRVVIPAHVKKIEDHAFQGCSKLEIVEFEEGSILSEIGAYAFADCPSLTNIALPGTLAELGGYAFAGCTNLESVEFVYYNKGRYEASPRFPEAISLIRQATFAGCSSLRRVELMGNNTAFHIGTDAFLHCLALRSFIVSDTVRGIGTYAFAHCVSLKEFAMPHIDAVEAIGRGAFLQCHELPYFQIPRALVTIPRYCFYGCESFRNVKIPANVSLVDSHAFAHCPNLEQVIIDRPSTKCMLGAFDSRAVIKRAEEAAV